MGENLTEQKDYQKSKKIKCFGISNVFANDDRRLFFNEYDDWEELAVKEEMLQLNKFFDIDLYLLMSSPKHYHLLSFDILTLRELKAIINYCTNDGDYLYNFYDKNFEYVLRLSEKEGNKPILISHLFTDKDKKYFSSQHLKAYDFFLGQKFPIPLTKLFLNLDTKIVVYQTNRRKK